MTASKNASQIKWQKENYARIPLDVRPEEKEKIKAYANSQGETVGAFIKKAIAERIERIDKGE